MTEGLALAHEPIVDEILVTELDNLYRKPINARKWNRQGERLVALTPIFFISHNRCSREWQENAGKLVDGEETQSGLGDEETQRALSAMLGLVQIQCCADPGHEGVNDPLISG